MALLTVRPIKVDVRTARSIASHTNHKAESLAQFLTWGADEKVLFAAAAFGWLCCRHANPSLSKLGDHLLATTVVLPCCRIS